MSGGGEAEKVEIARTMVTGTTTRNLPDDTQDSSLSEHIKQPPEVSVKTPAKEVYQDDQSSFQPASDEKMDRPQPQSNLRRTLGKIFWTPPWCRYDPNSPPQFSMFQNVLFAFAGAFTVANLYYPIAILNIIAHDFDIPYLTVSRIPTLAQSGYAAGLLLICPLGDLFPRRPYTLSLVFLTAALWIGLCVTKSFTVFLAITFITSITTVTPQIMLPLVGELAPPNKRAFSLSIVASGNLSGIVIARILSGVVTNYTNWRNIYWIALAMQFTIFIALYLFMPAYPSTNPLPPTNRVSAFLKTYPKLLFSILTIAFRYPVLIQAGMLAYCMSASFTCFWTTLTFLLSSPPYNLAPTPIGLFGLIGVAGIILGPFWAKYLIQPLKLPLYAVLVGATINLIGCCIGTYTGTFTLAGPIIQALGLDAGFNIVTVACRTAILKIGLDARNRVNTVFMLLSFLGQITGTSAGNVIYEEYGGWRSSGSLGVAMVVFSFVIVAVRGPWETGWFGWNGGWGRRDGRERVDEDRKGEGVEEKDECGDDEEAARKAVEAAERARTNALMRQLSHNSDVHTM